MEQTSCEHTKRLTQTKEIWEWARTKLGAAPIAAHPTTAASHTLHTNNKALCAHNSSDERTTKEFSGRWHGWHFFLFESGGGMSNYRLLIIEKIFSALSARVEVMFIDRKSSQTNWVILHICRSSHYVRRKWAPLRAYGESSDKAKANNKSKTVTERTKRQMIINFTIGGNEKANDWAANVENDDVDPWWRV